MIVDAKIENYDNLIEQIQEANEWASLFHIRYATNL